MIWNLWPTWIGWCFDTKTLRDEYAKAQKVISAEMRSFQPEIHAFHFGMDFHSNILVS